ncbi:MAG: hypothetical protein Q8P63_02060 [Candidatus Nealsonbacteria bacterium]|nr:hypothetical protein [Candidatus Nealsonbacteria bacterium]
MDYRLIIKGVNIAHQQAAVDDHLWPVEVIKITPLLNDSQMAAIKPMEGRGWDCDERGAEVRNVSSKAITIASCCDMCRKGLIRQIVQSLGKKTETIIKASA